MSVVLGVNLDHIATLRQARGTDYPRPADGAVICEACGVHGITLHLREDRRHIQEHDVIDVQKILKKCTLNLEMAVADDVVAFAKKIVPYMTTIVPERRQEITTEGGLDVKSNFEKLSAVTRDFHSLGIKVSLFIEPDNGTIDRTIDAGADYAEFHTGKYADAKNSAEREHELKRLFDAAEYAVSRGLRVNAGHGLNMENTAPVLAMKGLEELNIGHSIIARAIFVGLENAVLEMKQLIEREAK
jgi:pyridoxine 5-phosphate synthase